jgi:hypothetical protein
MRSGARLDADLVVDRSAEALFASEILLRGLDRGVPEQELNLFQFAARRMAKACA